MVSGPTNLRLYGEPLWYSPYVFSSFVALTEKGLPFEVEEVSLIDGQQRAPGYGAASVTEKVPTLEHGDFRLAESSAIAEYLEEVFAPPAYPRLFPADLLQRARARQLMAWLRSDLDALRQERSTITMFFRLQVPPLSPAGERAAQKLLRVAERLIPRDAGPLFGSWCLADSEFSFLLHRLVLNDYPLPERVKAYAEAQWRRPSVRGYIEHARPQRVPETYWAYVGMKRLEPLI